MYLPLDTLELRSVDHVPVSIQRVLVTSKQQSKTETNLLALPFQPQWGTVGMYPKMEFIVVAAVAFKPKYLDLSALNES
jgi:hypothetical protein